ncbi:MAG: ImmA/IrrE family metallo-endopeptidase [Dehalococcoidia bacterium]
MRQEKVAKWESELWSYISNSDGEHCPLYNDCQFRLQSQCLDDSKEYFQRINAFLDNEELTLSGSKPGKLEFIRCAKVSRIFQLVGKLANKYLKMGDVHSPPVPAVLVAQCDRSCPIEVREVPLKAYHGAIWRLRDKWIVHLNESDTVDRKKFSLFHEAFHILAHCKATPVFRKVGFKQGSFNELLADHFAGCILMPPEWAKEKWAELHDIDKMAETFQIPRSVVWFGLKGMDLI